jgi:hypothetical protein
MCTYFCIHRLMYLYLHWLMNWLDMFIIDEYTNNRDNHRNNPSISIIYVRIIFWLADIWFKSYKICWQSIESMKVSFYTVIWHDFEYLWSTMLWSIVQFCMKFFFFLSEVFSCALMHIFHPLHNESLNCSTSRQ